MIPSSIFNKNSQDRLSAYYGQVTWQNQARIAFETTKKACIELAKATEKIGLLALSSLVIGFVTYIVFKAATFALGILAFPVAVAIPKLYASLTTAGSFAAGATFATVLMNRYAKPYFNQGKEHFFQSIHLFSETKRVLTLNI